MDRVAHSGVNANTAPKPFNCGWPVQRNPYIMLAKFKPHIMKSKGGAWHVAYDSHVPWELVKAALVYRNDFLRG